MSDKKYGVWCYNCPCGWLTVLKMGQDKSDIKCACCGEIALPDTGWYFDEHVACAIAALSEVKSRKIQEIAEKYGFLVYRGKTRIVVYRIECPMTVGYGDNQKRAFMALEEMCVGAWQKCMMYLKDKIKDDLPEYLK